MEWNSVWIVSSYTLGTNTKYQPGVHQQRKTEISMWVSVSQRVRFCIFPYAISTNSSHPRAEERTRALPWYLRWGKEAGTGLFYFSVETQPLFPVVTGKVCVIAEGTDVNSSAKVYRLLVPQARERWRQAGAGAKMIRRMESPSYQGTPACSSYPLKACDQL